MKPKELPVKIVNAGAHDSVLLVTTCFEKSGRNKERICMLIVTRCRIILSPLPDAVSRKETASPAEGEEPPVPATESSWIRWLKGHPGPSPGSLTGLVREYRGREPEEILREEKDAKEIPFRDISAITIRRVRDTGKNSRWRSFLVSPFPFEPASARYAVDYELTIRTPGKTYTLLTPFLLEMKQTLVDQLGDRISEIIDSTAPLL